MGLKLFDVVEKEKWHSLQEGFSNALGIHMHTVDTDGRPMPGNNQPSNFCMEIIDALNRRPGREDHYRECVNALIENIRKNDAYHYSVCPMGDVFLYGIPIELDKNLILAYVIIGPVIAGKKKTEKEYKEIAMSKGVKADYLIENISGLRSFSFNGIESIVKLFHEVAHYVLQLNYDINSLRKRFTVPGPLESVINGIYSSNYVDELLKALLEAVLHTTKSKEGSIMVLNEKKNELTIKFSRGLTADITKNTKVKIGEGISGVVARDRRPLLINDEIRDSEIKDRLKRPYIKSSIVYPLEVKNRLLGVMNINETGSKQRFNTETLDLVDTLSNLTRIALAAFPKTAVV